MNIMNAIKSEISNTNLSTTKNGALGFAKCKSDIVDFFYNVSSMRILSAEKKQTEFLKVLAEDRDLAYRMLFFIRDVRGGLGERQLFRDVIRGIDEDDLLKLLPLIPEYGRWDDVLSLLMDDDTSKKAGSSGCGRRFQVSRRRSASFCFSFCLW